MVLDISCADFNRNKNEVAMTIFDRSDQKLSSEISEGSY